MCRFSWRLHEGFVGRAMYLVGEELQKRKLAGVTVTGANVSHVLVNASCAVP